MAHKFTAKKVLQYLPGLFTPPSLLPRIGSVHREVERRFHTRESLANSTSGDVQKKLAGLSLGSPLVCMGEHSRTRGCEFKSRHRIQDGLFLTIICC